MIEFQSQNMGFVDTGAKIEFSGSKGLVRTSNDMYESL